MRVLTYVIDLYAGDLDRASQRRLLEDAHLDRSGYYALARKDDRTATAGTAARFLRRAALAVRGTCPEPRRRIDRIALFRARPGLRLRADHTFDDEEYNTYACPWHHNLTAAICSFRTAKALKSNAGSHLRHPRPSAGTTRRRSTGSRSSCWTSGLMEPGQWF